MGTITFHPWPTRSGDNDHPDELRIDLDPQPGTTFTDAVRVAGVAARAARGARPHRLPEDARQPRRPRLRADRAALGASTDVRHAAIGFGRELEKRDAGVTTKWWKEERGERIFVDFNQNNRDRTIASAYSLRPLPGAPVSTPITWDELAQRHRPARRSTSSRCPSASPTATRGRHRRHGATRCEPLLDLYEELARGRDELPAGLSEDARRAAEGAAEQEGRGALGRGRQPDRAVTHRPARFRSPTMQNSRQGSASNLDSPGNPPGPTSSRVGLSPSS